VWNNKLDARYHSTLWCHNAPHCCRKHNNVCHKPNKLYLRKTLQNDISRATLRVHTKLHCSTSKTHLQRDHTYPNPHCSELGPNHIYLISIWNQDCEKSRKLPHQHKQILARKQIHTHYTQDPNRNPFTIYMHMKTISSKSARPQFDYQQIYM